ncbi:helix-turn-helix domain-containing protein [Nocardia tengchongensis]|uniref:PucR family transcriptional regulator n=1 Tax=Nocardia tengchongensis TaxID=2055889 RepID=UPI0033FE29F6
MSSTRAAAKQRMITLVLDNSPEMAQRVVARARAEMPVYARLSATTIARSTESILERLARALLDSRPLHAEDLSALREFGETRARQGVSLADVQSGWRIAVREILAELTSAAHTSKVADRVLLESITDLLDLVDQASISFSSAHREVEIAQARHDEQFRAEFTRALLLGTLGPAELQIRAQQLGLDTEGEYRAFRSRPDEDAASAALQGITSRFSTVRGFVTTVDGDLAGFVENSTPTGSRLIAYGPATRLTDLDRSFRLATRVLATAQLFGLSGPLDLDRVGLLPAIAADTELGAELAHRYLDPLGDGEAARTLIETAAQFLDAGMRVDVTAERLTVHPNTVRYRLARFEELANTDLRSAGTALQVWWAIQHRRATTGYPAPSS